MAKPIYQDDPDPPRRKRRRKNKGPRPLTPESRDCKLLRLPYNTFVSLSQAAEIMGVERRSIQANYLYSQTYRLPDFIETISDKYIIGFKRIGP